MMDTLTPCPFCHHDLVDIVDESIARADGSEWRGDMANCRRCLASAPVDLWARLIHFLAPIQELAKEVLHG